ncbi:---NA--- [Paramuricea clavata]|uniref:---NA n=1 Tax=Paramuricea clavata TaxID=317549 RepID=A0A6S7GGP6_PARCT|nr:---NA--- [Paramuricea clavata]
MGLHLSNPFHENISLILMILAFYSFQYRVGIGIVERAHEFLLSAQKDKAPTNNTAKTVAATCFTCLGILFHTLGDLEKAETLIVMASQLFTEIQESVEREKLPFKTITCDIMKEILPSKKFLPSDKYSIMKEVLADWNRFLEHQKHHKERQDTLAEDSKTSENCSNGRQNVELLIPTSDGVKPREIDSSDPKTVGFQRKQIIQPGSTYLDALEYNRKKGNVHQAVKIYTSLQAHELSFYESCPCDSVEKLISDAIRAKEDNRLSSGIGSLDLALQLPSNWREKTKTLKLRGECYLSRGDFRTATINFNEAACIYSRETVETRDDLCEYSEVLIGLIKSETLCQNVAGAWLKCREAIKLVSNHEHRESIHLQEIELLYLGAKCQDILSESAEESKDDKLAQACSLCQQALLILSLDVDQTRNSSELMEELGTSEPGKCFALKCEVQLLLAVVFLKLRKKEEAERILKETQEFLMNIPDAFESLSANWQNLQMVAGKPEFLSIYRRLFSWIGRVLVMRDKIKRSITWLSESL